MTALLLILLPSALKYIDGGDKRYIVHAALGLFCSFVVAHTTFAVIAGWPRRDEWTVSKALERLCLDHDHKNWTLYCSFGKYINRVSPTKDHIKAVL